MAGTVGSLSQELIRRSFIATEKNIYLTVMDKDKFEFAFVENGELQFAEKIDYEGQDIYAQKLPIINGKVKPIVGVPHVSTMVLVETPKAADLFEDIKLHLQKYLDAPGSEYDLLACYILFTWFYPKVNTLPYLRFLGDTGKGKSRFLTIVSSLCFYPLVANGSSTSSGAMRLNELWHGTFVMDEADLDGGARNPFVKYINTGFEKHNSVHTKCKPSNYEENEYFDAFCPKVFAMREHFKDNATEGRVFSFTPKETRRKDIPVILPKRYDVEVEVLRARIANFVLFNWNKVDGNKLLDYQEFDVESRIKQILIPISIICQLLPQGDEMLKKYILRRQKELKYVRAQSFEGIAFNHVYALAVGDEIPSSKFEDFITASGVAAITPSMAAEGLGSSPTGVTKALQSIGMMSESQRIGRASGKKVNTRYLAVPDGDRWREIIQRYWISDSEDELLEQFPECPEILKSRNYKECAE